MTDLVLDDASVMEGLNAAADLGWSGVLRVLSGRHQIGTVVFRDGRVAWAVCQYQKEDLGSFLQRLGCISKTQLRDIRKQYEALGKTKKFATLLDEAGILGKTALKDYLRQHVSRAVTCLSSLSGCTISASGGEFKVDETLTFTLEDIFDDPEKLPGAGECRLPSIVPNSGAISPDVFGMLSKVPGYRSSLIGAIEGKIYVSHNLDESSTDESVLLGAPAAWLKSVLTITVDAGLGPLRASVLEAEGGQIVAQFIRPEFGIFIAMYMDENGRLGAARHRLDQVAKELQESIQLSLQTHQTRGK